MLGAHSMPQFLRLLHGKRGLSQGKKGIPEDLVVENNSCSQSTKSKIFFQNVH